MRREIWTGAAANTHEPLLTFREAAKLFGIQYWKIQRAAKLGLIPTCTLLNSRRYVRRSDIERLLAPQEAQDARGQQGSFEFPEIVATKDEKGGSR